MRNMLTGDNPARAGEDSYGKSEAIMIPPKGTGPLLKQRLWLYFCSRVIWNDNDQMYMYRQSPRADERVTSTEANEVVKDVGKTDRKPAQQKQAVDGKDKKLSIHERLEINKRIIQEKQGKDKPERGADRGVR